MHRPWEACCFNTSDVAVLQMGGAGNVLVVDGLLCRAFLGFVLEVAEAARAWQWYEAEEHFPGEVFYLSLLRATAASVPWVGRLLLHVEKVWAALFDCIALAVASAGFQLAPEWDSANQEVDQGRFSMVTRPPRTNTVHIDRHVAVVNFHLSHGFEDTGTAFYVSMDGQEICLDAERVSCHRQLAEHADFILREQARLRLGARCVDKDVRCERLAENGTCPQDPERLYAECAASCGVCAGLWPGPFLPRGEDHSARFRVRRVEAFRLNRLLLYNGHLFHSGYFSNASIPRLLARDHSRGRSRLMLQRGVPLGGPLHELLAPAAVTQHGKCTTAS